MSPSLRALRETHRSLRTRVERIGHIAGQVGHISFAALREEVAGTVAFLRDDLIPHAVTEEKHLYPLIGRILGLKAIVPMSRDHFEMELMTEELEALLDRLTNPPLAIETAEHLRRLLSALHAMIMVHFAKEEELYLPLLEERLTTDEADQLIREMKPNGEPVFS